jgi:hypothetical protein
MQNGRGLPPRPSFLPRYPHPNTHIAAAPSNGLQNHQEEIRLMNGAMASPQTNVYASYHSSHYAQAYMQGALGNVACSSTLHYAAPYALPIAPSPAIVPDIRLPPARSSWYQPGNYRCDHKDCTFTGSQKSVEIHKMDRHLLFPPGWEKRKKKPDWDADPSLIGYVHLHAYQQTGK